MFPLCCECLVFRGGTVNGKMGVISLTAGGGGGREGCSSELIKTVN